MSEPIEIVLRGNAQADETLSYKHLPFEVPTGIGRIDVAYDYSAAISSDPTVSGGNTVDIGIFDVRGVEWMSPGFRGWSGSARRSFSIGLREATPGYMPGSIQAGTWYICLGFYKVAEAGCDYTVTIKLIPAEDGDAGFPDLLPLREETRRPAKPDGWYRGELHCHTYHSDGDSDPQALVDRALALGLDFLAVTDHNVRSQQAALNRIDPPLTLIPGYEVTTYKGHWNIWGGEGWIDFRILTPDKLASAMEAARAGGYLVSCNHPRPYGPPWEFTQVDLYDCIEVWNGPWRLFNDQAIHFWEQKLAQGKRCVAVGGSDAHFLRSEHVAQIGTPTMWIHCDGAPSAANLLRELRKGHAFISDAPDGAQLYLSCGDAIAGDSVPRPVDGMASVSVRAVNAQGTLLELHGSGGLLAQRRPIEADEQTLRVPIPADETAYVRAQLVDADDPCLVRALTNPIYFDERH